MLKPINVEELKKLMEQDKGCSFIDSMTDVQLNYLCAIAEGMIPVFDELNGVDYVFIEKKSNSTSASYANLSPTAFSKSTLAVEYDPVGNWAQAGELIEKHKIRIFPMHEQGGKFFGWTAKALPWWLEACDKNPRRAVVMGLIFHYLGGSDGVQKRSHS